MTRKLTFYLLALVLCEVIVPSAEPTLLQAITNEDKAAVVALLESGSEANFVDPETGTTPLALATGGDDIDTIRLLLKHGARADYSESAAGWHTALHVAAYSVAKTDVIKLLLKTKPNLNVKNEAGGTPVMVAAHIGNIEALKLFIKAGADVHAEANDGNTALILAVQNDKIEAVEVLLKAKADPNHLNKSKRGALYYALETENDRVLKLLRKYKVRLPETAETHQELFDLAGKTKWEDFLNSLKK